MESESFVHRYIDEISLDSSVDIVVGRYIDWKIKRDGEMSGREMIRAAHESKIFLKWLLSEASRLKDLQEAGV